MPFSCVNCFFSDRDNPCPFFDRQLIPTLESLKHLIPFLLKLVCPVMLLHHLKPSFTTHFSERSGKLGQLRYRCVCASSGIFVKKHPEFVCYITGAIQPDFSFRNLDATGVRLILAVCCWTWINPANSSAPRISRIVSLPEVQIASSLIPKVIRGC